MMTPDAWWTEFLERAADPATAVDIAGQLIVTAGSFLGAVFILRSQFRHDRLARKHHRRAEEARHLAHEISFIKPMLSVSSRELGQYFIAHRRPPFAELTEEIRGKAFASHIGFEEHPVRRRLTELTVLWRIARTVKAEVRDLPVEAVGYSVRALLAGTVEALERACVELREWDGASAVPPSLVSTSEGSMPPDSDLVAREEWRDERRRAFLELAHRRAGLTSAAPRRGHDQDASFVHSVPQGSTRPSP